MNDFDRAIKEAIDSDKDLLIFAVANTLRSAASGEQWAVELLARTLTKIEEESKNGQS